MSNSSKEKNEIDLALVKLAQAGNSQAYEDLLLRHKDSIEIIINKRVFDSQLHEDMRQEARIAFVRAIENFEPGKARFITYASRVIENALISLARKRDKSPYEVLGEADLHPHFETPSETDIEQEVTHSLMEDALVSFIEEELSELEAKVFRLDAQGLTNIEIARRLKLEVRSVANALNRANNKFKQAFPKDA